MKTTLELTRLWAALTGLVLSAAFFASAYLGVKSTEMVPMLISGIGGFELVLFAQDVWFRRRRQKS